MKENKKIIGGLKVVNLCPHPIDLIDLNGQSHNIQGIGNDAIRRSEEVVEGTVGPFKHFEVTMGQADQLPDPEVDTIFIVSMASLGGIPTERTDVFAPGNAKRDAEGFVIGAEGIKSVRGL